MAKRDADGMIRVDLEWTIEGRNGTKRGCARGVREQDVPATKRTIALGALRGDTVTVNEI